MKARGTPIDGCPGQYKRFKKKPPLAWRHGGFSYAFIATMMSNTKTSPKKKSYRVIGNALLQGADISLRIKQKYCFILRKEV